MILNSFGRNNIYTIYFIVVLNINILCVTKINDVIQNVYCKNPIQYRSAAMTYFFFNFSGHRNKTNIFNTNKLFIF